jgi:hypothetical protein
MGKGKRFTRAEVGRLFGRRVRLTVEFSDVRVGTTGKVVGTDEVEPEGFEILVRWEGLDAGTHSTYWFTREEFERCLVET